MQHAIDRIMRTYGLMVNITLAEEQEARRQVTLHLGGQDQASPNGALLDDDERKLTVEGLRFLRALRLESSHPGIGCHQDADAPDDHADEDPDHARSRPTDRPAAPRVLRA